MSKTSTAWSSVGKKVLNGLTGLGLVIFVIVHLIGNLTIFAGPEALNGYANTLSVIGHGALLPIAEVGLALLFILHIVSALTVFNDKGKARPVAYYRVADAGGKSKKTMSSKNMIWTGLVLLVFVIIHLIQFRFGPFYPVEVEHHQIRDLYRVVAGVFSQPGWVIFYCAMMLFLGFHLRHGVWSMFQSLGWNNRRMLPGLYGAGVVVGVVLALGFFVLPIYVMATSHTTTVGGLLP